LINSQMGIWGFQGT